MKINFPLSFVRYQFNQFLSMTHIVRFCLQFWQREYELAYQSIAIFLLLSLFCYILESRLMVPIKVYQINVFNFFFKFFIVWKIILFLVSMLSRWEISCFKLEKDSFKNGFLIAFIFDIYALLFVCFLHYCLVRVWQSVLCHFREINKLVTMQFKRQKYSWNFWRYSYA